MPGAAYLEKSRWNDGFACPHCGIVGDPFHFENRPGVLRCRTCRKNTGLTVGTVMERSHMPLSVWFWAAYLRLARFFDSAVELMTVMARAAGHRHLSEFAFDDLTTFDIDMARLTGVAYGGVSSI